MSKKQYVRALTIAGSDSGGGAGIQADLKTFSALGCFGMTAITSITAQNTIGVQVIYDLEAEVIEKQILAILDDIGVDVIKIGMLHRSDVIECVARLLHPLRGKTPIVVDPVMIAKSGHHLLHENAIEALMKKILPLTTVLTPNIPEASKLLDESITSYEEMERAAQKLAALGPQSIVIKGGHFNDEGQSNDFLWYQTEKRGFWFKNKRINTNNTHGTGCTFSAAIAAFLGKGQSISNAVQSAKAYISNALLTGAQYKLGKGHGPVLHFFENII